MISLNGQQQTTLEGSHYSVHLRIEVEDAAGNWVDLTSAQGVDFVNGLDYGFSVDQPIPRFTAYLQRKHGDLSLEPLDEDSLLNRNSSTGDYGALVDIGRRVRCWTATVGLTDTPGANDWILVVDGRADRVELAGEEMLVIGRDRIGALVQDRWIEEPDEELRVYGTDPGQLSELTIQAILDDWADGEVLYTPDAPTSAFVPTYKPPQQPVYQATSEIARKANRALWPQYENGAWRMAYVPVDRTKTAIDWTFGPEDYRDVTRLDVDVTYVRNAFIFTWAGGTSTLENNTSIARYGRHPLIITEPADSPIDTEAEKDAFLAALNSDLADPIAEQEIETLYWPAGQLNDLYRFLPNGVHYTVAQDWAATGFQHSLRRDHHRTRISARGKPAGAYLAHHQNITVTDDALTLLINDAKWTPPGPALPVYAGTGRFRMDLTLGKIGAAVRSVKVELLLDGVAAQQPYYQTLPDGDDPKIRVRISETGLFSDPFGNDGHGSEYYVTIGTGDWTVRVTPYSRSVTDLGLNSTTDLRNLGINWTTEDQLTEGEAGNPGEARSAPLGEPVAEGWGSTFEPHRPGGPPVGGPDEMFIAGTTLIGRPALDFDQEAITGRPQIRMRAPYVNSAVSGVWTPEYVNGPVQGVDLFGDTTILPPADILPGETLHLHIRTNGHDFSLGGLFVVPEGLRVGRSGKCHANFVCDPWGEVSGLILSNMLPEAAA